MSLPQPRVHFTQCVVHGPDRHSTGPCLRCQEDLGRRQVLTLEVIQYIAEEVQRQHDQPEFVYTMCYAWVLAVDDHRATGGQIDLGLIERWGKWVQPVMNVHGFRIESVWVGGRPCTPPSLVRMEMQDWLKKVRSGVYTPEHSYYHFELIHPFADGNGRTGKIIYNYLKDTLWRPEMPPDFFGVPNP